MEGGSFPQQTEDGTEQTDRQAGENAKVVPIRKVALERFALTWFLDFLGHWERSLEPSMQ